MDDLCDLLSYLNGVCHPDDDLAQQAGSDPNDG